MPILKKDTRARACATWATSLSEPAEPSASMPRPKPALMTPRPIAYWDGRIASRLKCRPTCKDFIRQTKLAETRASPATASRRVSVPALFLLVLRRATDRSAPDRCGVLYPREGPAGALCHARISCPLGGGEVSDRLRSAALTHDVRRP